MVTENRSHRTLLALPRAVATFLMLPWPALAAHAVGVDLLAASAGFAGYNAAGAR
ncbi:MAG: hypothetical protein ACTHMU_25495 [Thermomicrobiales bacterium]